MRKGLFKRILAGFMAFALIFMSVDSGCITAMAADLAEGQTVVEEASSITVTVNPENNPVRPAYGTATGYIDTGYQPERVDLNKSEGGISLDKDTNILSSYRSPYVTSVKNQNPYGTCWAFSAIAAMESYALAHGYVDDPEDINFSEYALVYQTFIDDMFMDKTGDFTTTTLTINQFMNSGGNDQYAFKALSKGIGLYNEIPGEYGAKDDLDELIAYVADESNSDFILVGQQFISMEDPNQVKAAVMQNGAATISYWSDDAYQNDYHTYYYYSDTTNLSTNHAVTLVGWDDTMSRDLFTTQKGGTPSRDGAWLVKNSWGTYAGDDGYMWISYEDVSVNISDVTIYKVEPRENYDNLYQHDGATSFLAKTSGTRFASTFCIEGEEKQLLKAVSFAIGTVNADYTVEIYKHEEENTLDQGVLVATGSGTTTYEGYYTVGLNQSVLVHPGETYTVILKFDKTVYIVYGYSFDSGIFASTSTSKPGEDYRFNGREYVDLYEQGYANVCIKLFTKDVEPLPEVTVADIPNQTYSGVAITPEIVVTTVDGLTTLSKDTDYKLSYSNNTNAGTATVTITFIGNYTGKEAITKEFVIDPMSSGDENFLFDFVMDDEWAHEITYSGQEIKLGVTITDGLITLVEGKDYTIKYPNDCVNVGMKSVIVTLINNYTGSYFYGYDIIPKVLTLSNITPIPDQTFFAQDIEPELVIKDGDYVLVEDKDYTVEYENNYLISTEAKALVTFKGNYTNEVENEPVVVNFNIIAKSQEDLTITIPDQVYDGTAKEPNPVIMYNGKQLVKDTDYEVSFRNNTNAGDDAIAYISFVGSYAEIDSIEKTFTISALELDAESVEITNIKMGYEYTGYEVYINPVIKYNGKVLSSGADYLIGYSQNCDVGNAIYYIEFMGNYSGRVEGTFEIVPKEVASENAVVSGLIEEVIYSGSQISYENIVVTVGNEELVYGEDFTVAIAENSESNGLDAGTVTLVITFNGNYSGTLTATYEIVPLEIDPLDIIITDKNGQTSISYEYTGLEIVPEFVVTVNGVEVGYRIEYLPAEGEMVADRINVGTVMYKVILTGNYVGENIKTFAITEKSGVNLEISEIEDQEYTGEEIEPEVIVKDGEMVLIEGADYTVTYSNNIDAGEANITIVYMGNYKGSESIAFTITPIELDSELITFAEKDENGYIIPLVDEDGNPITKFTYIYTGNPVIPVIEIACGELVSGEDGTLEFEVVFADDVDHTNAGTVEFTVVLTGNYSGSITGTLEILPNEISENDDKLIIANIAQQEYTGRPIIPQVLIMYNGVLLVEDEDYELSVAQGVDNINVGIVELTITFIGNYSGEATKEFEIIPAEPEEPGDITSDDVDINDETGYISKISVGTTVQAFFEMLDANASVKVLDKNNETVSNDALLGTGMKVCIMNGNEVVKSYDIIVTGDTNGDGKINITDMIAVKAMVLKKSNLEGAYAKAADVNGDAKVNITDFIKAKAVTLKKDTIVGVVAK